MVHTVMTPSRNWQLSRELTLAASLALLGVAPGCHQGVSVLPPAELIATVSPGEVVGLVTDAQSGAPLPDAIVRLTPTELQARTDASGQFRLGPAPEGRYLLRVLRVGFVARADSLVLAPASGAAVAVRLSRTTVRLEYVGAGAEMRP